MRSSRFAAAAVANADGDLTALERVLVDPLNRVGRAVRILASSVPSTRKRTVGGATSPSAGP